MTVIDPTACVADGAAIGPQVTIGPYCVIGANVTIGEGCTLVAHVHVAGHTSIGPRTRIYPFTSLGTPPQSVKYRGGPTRLEIGAGCDIREHVTMNLGTEDGGGLQDHGIAAGREFVRIVRKARLVGGAAGECEWIDG